MRLLKIVKLIKTQFRLYKTKIGFKIIIILKNLELRLMYHFFLDFLEILKEFLIQFQQKVSLVLQFYLLAKDLL